ncbi:hypothetical protein D3C75_808060 [compost metagenome]
MKDVSGYQGMNAETNAQARSTGTHVLLADDHGVQTVCTVATVFFRNAREQQAQLTGTAPDFARHAFFFFPLGVERQHFVCQKALGQTAVIFVLRAEQGTGDQIFHGKFLDGAVIRACARPALS